MYNGQYTFSCRSFASPQTKTLSHCQVVCYDKDEDTSSDMIGEFTCNTAKLMEAKDNAVSRMHLCQSSLKVCLFFLFGLFLQVQCFDYDSDGSHDLIGVFQTNVSEMQKAVHGSPVRLPPTQCPPLCVQKTTFFLHINVYCIAIVPHLIQLYPVVKN